MPPTTSTTPPRQVAALLTSARAYSRAHAPWLWPSHTPAVAVWWLLAAAAIYLGKWGRNTVHAIQTLTGQGDAPPHGADWHTTFLTTRVTELLVAMVVIAATALMLVWMGRKDTLRLPRSKDDLLAELNAGGWWFAGLLVAVYVAPVLTPSILGYPYDDRAYLTTPQATYSLLKTAFSGASEEIWFGPLLVTLLRRRGYGWRVILPVAAVLRGAFHVYYGAPTWGIVVWGAVVAGAYLLTGRWWLPFVLHGFHDIVADVDHLFPGTLATVFDSIECIFSLGVPVAAAVLWALGVERRRQERHADQD